jgi:ADP-ribosylglycohydrolase
VDDKIFSGEPYLQQEDEMPTLFEKVYGCLAASRVASSMGAAVEGWHADKIAGTYGYLEKLLPYIHYSNRGVTWERMPGTTEDGIERQKLMCQAIIEKQDRITVEDLARVAVERVDPDKMWYMSEPDDIKLVQFLKAGIHPADVGGLSAWNGLNAMARASHPIGLINAGDPAGAVRDAADVGRMLFRPADVALAWAGVYDAAIAGAMMPGATVESVIACTFSAIEFIKQSVTHKSWNPDHIKIEIQRSLDIVTQTNDYDKARVELYSLYNGFGTPYAMSSAAETVSKALAMFVLADGDARTAVLYGVNLGRDTDCMAAMGGGLAGALSGIGAVPGEWVKQVDEATFANPYTNIQVKIEDHARGVFGALQSRARRMSELASVLTS